MLGAPVSGIGDPDLLCRFFTLHFFTIGLEVKLRYHRMFQICGCWWAEFTLHAESLSSNESTFLWLSHLWANRTLTNLCWILLCSVNGDSSGFQTVVSSSWRRSRRGKYDWSELWLGVYVGGPSDWSSQRSIVAPTVADVAINLPLFISWHAEWCLQVMLQYLQSQLSQKTKQLDSLQAVEVRGVELQKQVETLQKKLYEARRSQAPVCWFFPQILFIHVEHVFWR